MNDVWSSSFVVSDNSGEVDNLRLAWNDVYNNFLALYVCTEVGEQSEVWVGGYRSQQIDPGSPVAGSPAIFSLSGFRAFDSFQVVAAEGLGSLVIPDGRDLGLTFDSYTRITKSLGAFSGIFDSFGNASTSSLVIPVNLSGRSLYLVAASLTGGGVRDISDVTRVDIQ